MRFPVGTLGALVDISTQVSNLTLNNKQQPVYAVHSEPTAHFMLVFKFSVLEKIVFKKGLSEAKRRVIVHFIQG
jgi:hypothetical protein